MSLFESAFGNWDFWQEIGGKMVRVKLMIFAEMLENQGILNVLSLMDVDFVGMK